MKRFFSALLLVSLAFMLVACTDGDSSNPAYEVPPFEGSGSGNFEPEVGSTQVYTHSLNSFELSIALATRDLMSTFDYVHVFDYTHLREARDQGNVDRFNGDRLVLWANEPMRDFSLISIGNDVINDELFFIPLDAFGLVDELLPGQGFVIESYVSLGTLSWSGITFVDEDNVKQYFTIQQDNSDYFPPYRLIWFENRSDELPPDWNPWWEEPAD